MSTMMFHTSAFVAVLTMASSRPVSGRPGWPKQTLSTVAVSLSVLISTGPDSDASAPATKNEQSGIKNHSEGAHAVCMRRKS